MDLMKSRREPRENGPLRCPGDGGRLEKVEREGVTLDRCGSCGGIWFDARELARVTREATVERLARRVGPYAAESAFPCPRCGGKCYKSFVVEVEADTCSACRGVWLDAFELEEAKRQVRTERELSRTGPGLLAFLRRL